MENIIEMHNLSKRYTITHQRGGYVALRDVIANIAKRPLRFAQAKVRNAMGAGSKEEFWALKDVSLDVRPGEVVGIIGRNGAGKSTLLKILTGITPPTTGEAIMRGKVASLLEVGTGFHPELTGRENIFLNGAILGMQRRDIVKNFDAIVSFAGVETFIDTPVKHYSSGMHVRLAFSVAAHLEPDILLVDEVLAVGDAEFQKKCLGKMEEVTKQDGRTILFVSHNMGAVEQLCTKAVLLEKGRVVKMSDNVHDVIDRYLHGEESSGERTGTWTNPGTEFESDWFKPLRFYLSDENGRSASDTFDRSKRAWINVEGEVKELDPSLTIGYAIYNENNQLLYWTFDTDRPQAAWPKIEKGVFALRTELPLAMMNEETYRIELLAALHNRVWILKPEANAPSIHLRVSGSLSESPYWTSRRPGAIAPLFTWETVGTPRVS